MGISSVGSSASYTPTYTPPPSSSSSNGYMTSDEANKMEMQSVDEYQSTAQEAEKQQKEDDQANYPVVEDSPK